MATVTTNSLVEGISGMLGNLVFKNMRGKTFVTRSPQRPQQQSTQQKENRSKFRDASAWAKEVLADSERKAYYQKKAKKLQLPNAYTAAITDYMRKPKVISFTNHDNTITCTVSKKDFQLKKVEVIVQQADGDEVRVITPQGSDWYFKLAKEEIDTACVRVTDDAGKDFEFQISDF